MRILNTHFTKRDAAVMLIKIIVTLWIYPQVKYLNRFIIFNEFQWLVNNKVKWNGVTF